MLSNPAICETNMEEAEGEDFNILGPCWILLHYPSALFDINREDTVSYWMKNWLGIHWRISVLLCILIDCINNGELKRTALSTLLLFSANLFSLGFETMCVWFNSRFHLASLATVAFVRLSYALSCRNIPLSSTLFCCICLLHHSGIFITWLICFLLGDHNTDIELPAWICFFTEGLTHHLLLSLSECEHGLSSLLW